MFIIIEDRYYDSHQELVNNKKHCDRAFDNKITGYLQLKCYRNANIIKLKWVNLQENDTGKVNHKELRNEVKEYRIKLVFIFATHLSVK